MARVTLYYPTYRKLNPVQFRKSVRVTFIVSFINSRYTVLNGVELELVQTGGRRKVLSFQFKERFYLQNQSVRTKKSMLNVDVRNSTNLCFTRDLPNSLL